MDENEEELVPVWCMAHGLPEAHHKHFEDHTCMFRMIRDDEKLRLEELMDQLTFTWEEDGQEQLWILAEGHRMPTTTHEVQLIKEVERLRELLWGENL